MTVKSPKLQHFPCLITSRLCLPWPTVRAKDTHLKSIVLQPYRLDTFWSVEEAGGKRQRGRKHGGISTGVCVWSCIRKKEPEGRGGAAGGRGESHRKKDFVPRPCLVYPARITGLSSRLRFCLKYLGQRFGRGNDHQTGLFPLIYCWGRPWARHRSCVKRLRSGRAQ